MAIKSPLSEAVRTETDALGALNKEIAEFSANIRERLDREKRRLQIAVNNETLPIQFTGTVHSYTYGMLEGSDIEDPMPKHRFQLECGRGLWLSCEATGTEWDSFFRTMNVKRMRGPADINGKTVIVTRVPALNRAIPTRMVKALVLNGAPLETPQGDLLEVGGSVVTDDGYSGVIQPAAGARNPRFSDGNAAFEIRTVETGDILAFRVDRIKDYTAPITEDPDFGPSFDEPDDI